MANKMAIVVVVMLLLLAAVGTFLGVFYGTRRPQNNEGFYRAAVAADAGPCSDVGM